MFFFMEETMATNKSKDMIDINATREEREKALEAALNQIEKQYGKGAVMRLGERPATNVDVIPSGSILLDNALGIGGYPKGRIIEI
jgi:recombination protein RecA